jgi:hypothetical protein
MESVRSALQATLQMKGLDVRELGGSINVTPGDKIVVLSVSYGPTNFLKQVFTLT